jgi:hypothetical protein
MPRRDAGFMAALLVCAASPAFASGPSAIRDRVDALEPKLIEWRRDIHQHPELSNREFRTAALVAEEGAPPGEEGGAKLMLKEGLFEWK